MFPGINTKREIDTLQSKSSPSTAVATSLPASAIFMSSPAMARLVQQVRLANVKPKQPHVATDVDDTVWDATSSTKQNEPRYHGLSSSAALSRDANMFRNGYHSNSVLSDVPTTHRRPEFWRPTAAEMRHLNQSPWETEEGLTLELPPDDLMLLLIDAFFEHPFFPIIHRPMFNKQLKEGLHRRDGVFLRVVLLVCANGARWCDDPRVLDERWPVPLSAGYRWFRQLEPGHQTFIKQISLHEAQLLVVSILCYRLWVIPNGMISLLQCIPLVHRRHMNHGMWLG
jgi:hypothetical protein